MGALSERLCPLSSDSAFFPNGVRHHQISVWLSILPMSGPACRGVVARDAQSIQCMPRSPCRNTVPSRRHSLRPTRPCHSIRWSRVEAAGKEKGSYVELEMEVFRFMEMTQKPDAFPTRQELIEAGRWDLVKAIQREGGWLAVGWEDDLEDDALSLSSDDSLKSKPVSASAKSWYSWQGSTNSKIPQGARPPAASLAPEGQDLFTNLANTSLPGSVNSNVAAATPLAGVKGVDFSKTPSTASRTESTLESRLDALTKEHIAGLGLGFDSWRDQSLRTARNVPFKETAGFSDSNKQLEKNGVAADQKPPREEKKDGDDGQGVNGAPSISARGMPVQEAAEVREKNGVAANKNLPAKEKKGGDDGQGLNGAPSISARGMPIGEAAEVQAEEAEIVNEIKEKEKEVTEKEAQKALDTALDAEAESAGANLLALLEEGTSPGTSPEAEGNVNEETVVKVDGAEEGLTDARESLSDGQEAEESKEGLQSEGLPEAKKRAIALPPKQKPPNYWQDPENLQHEMRAAQKALGLPDGVIPSKRQLISLKRWDILKAVKRGGGMRQVLAGQSATEKEAKREPPAPDPPTPEPQPELSPLDRLLNLIGLGPKRKVETPKASAFSSPSEEVDEATIAQDEQEVAQRLKESLAPQFLRRKKGRRRDEKSVGAEGEGQNAVSVQVEGEEQVAQRLKESLTSRRKKGKRRDAESIETAGEGQNAHSVEVKDEDRPAQRLKESLTPRRKKGRRRDEKSIETEGEEKNANSVEVKEKRRVEPETRTKVADVVEGRKEGAADVSNGRGKKATLRAEPETSAVAAEPPAQSDSLLQRIRALEQSLASTRDALQQDRESLAESREFLKSLRMSTLRELSEVSDSLEFRDNEMQKAAQALRSTQAEMRVFESSIASHSLGNSDAVDDILADPKNPEDVLTVVDLRTVRVVWPHEGQEVVLTGSFNGWQDRIKMVKSNAGVFIASLDLPPGRYEIKFIVDGVWRVDAQRLITYADGNENNVLIVV